MRLKRLLAGHARLALVLLWLGAAVDLVRADSGIAVVEGPTMITPGNPPCNAERITTFKVVIANNNLVCNEHVKISKAGFPKVKEEMSPLKSFEFLGFRWDESGVPPEPPNLAQLSDELEESDMEDESQMTFYFYVRTKPVPALVG